MSSANIKKRTAFTAAAMALALGAMGMAGCSSDNGQQANQNNSSESQVGQSAGTSSASSTDTYDFSYTDRDLDPSYEASEVVEIALSGTDFTCSSAAVSASETGLVITEPGVYKISGSYEGTVTASIADDKKIQLVLSGVDIVGTENNPAIKVEAADKAFITVEDGTENSVRDRGTVLEDADDNSAIWASCDLTVQGNGTLSVTGDRADGLKSKDDLSITGGNVTVTAKNDAVVGHDSVKMTKVSLTATAQDGDAIRSTEEDKENKGFVSIDDGNITLKGSDDGIDVSHYFRLAGGRVTIEAGDDGINSDKDAGIEGGELSVAAEDDGIHAEYLLVVSDGQVDVSKSYEGYEAQNITIKGGTSFIVASDDGINASPANGASSESTDSPWEPFEGEHSGQEQDADADGNGQQPPEPPDGEQPQMPDGQKPPELLDGQAPGDGQQPPEGMDGQGRGNGQRPDGKPGMGADGEQGRQRGGQRPDENGQDVVGTQNADKGQAGNDRQADGGKAGNGMRGGFGGGMDVSEDCSLVIEGGTVYVDARGDGLDSNGSIEINGGMVLVNGPENNGNAAVDFGTSATINGGVLVAAGTSGMYEGFSSGAQSFVEASVRFSAGDAIALVKDGKVVASMTAARSGDHVVFSTPDIEEGTEYEVVGGGAIAGTDNHGYSQGTQVTGGSATSATAVKESSGSGMGEFGGMRGAGRERVNNDGAEA